MSDLYTELLVKKESTPKDALVKYGMILLTGIAAAVGLLIHPLGLLAMIGLGIADYFILPKTSLEYEYLFINGDFDIDMIMSQSKRKRVMSFRLQDADIAAPLSSHRLDYYNGNQQMKVYDFSSGNPEHKRFGIITKVDEATARIILEPDSALMDKMKKCAPSKVFLD